MAIARSCSKTKAKLASHSWHRRAVHRTQKLARRLQEPGRCVCSVSHSASAWESPPSTARGAEQTSGTAIVVGAGVAGILTALELARFGMDVHVRSEFMQACVCLVVKLRLARESTKAPVWPIQRWLWRRRSRADHRTWAVQSECMRTVTRQPGLQVYDQKRIRQHEATATSMVPLTPSTVVELQGMGINIRGAPLPPFGFHTLPRKPENRCHEP